MNENYDLVYPELSDYYDVNVTNSNFSKLADGIDAIKSGGVKKEIVVAAYNTVNKYKDVADFVCGKDSCVSILNSALDACTEGGELIFLDGDYYFNSTFTVDKAVNITGCGAKTRFTPLGTFSGYAVVTVKGDDVMIKDISFEDVTTSKELHFIAVSANNIKLSGCDFMQNTTYTGSCAPLYVEAYKCRVLVSGCYVRKHDDTSWFIYGKTKVIGVVMGNYCDCIDDESELPVKIHVADVESAERIKTGAQNTYIFTESGGVYSE